MKKCGRYKTFSFALEEYKKMAADKMFFKPDMYIFLYANEDVRNQRNLCRSKSLGKKWLDADFLYYQNEFYKRVSKSIKNKLEIDTTYEQQSYVSECVLDILEKTYNKENFLDK